MVKNFFGWCLSSLLLFFCSGIIIFSIEASGWSSSSCNYVYTAPDYIYPTDICTAYGGSGMMFQCLDDGNATISYWNNEECQGDPFSTSHVMDEYSNATWECNADKSGYQCDITLIRSYPNSCNTNDTYHLDTYYVNNVCVSIASSTEGFVYSFWYTCQDNIQNMYYSYTPDCSRTDGTSSVQTHCFGIGRNEVFCLGTRDTSITSTLIDTTTFIDSTLTDTTTLVDSTLTDTTVLTDTTTTTLMDTTTSIDSTLVDTTTAMETTAIDWSCNYFSADLYLYPIDQCISNFGSSYMYQCTDGGNVTRGRWSNSDCQGVPAFTDHMNGMYGNTWRCNATNSGDQCNLSAVRTALDGNCNNLGDNYSLMYYVNNVCVKVLSTDGSDDYYLMYTCQNDIMTRYISSTPDCGTIASSNQSSCTTSSRSDVYCAGKGVSTNSTSVDTTTLTDTTKLSENTTMAGITTTAIEMSTSTLSSSSTTTTTTTATTTTSSSTDEANSASDIFPLLSFFFILSFIFFFF